MFVSIRSLAVIAAACLLLSPGAGAVSVGQTDDFEDGSIQGWVAGGGINQQSPPIPPANVGDGGPGGAGDNFLLVTGIGGLGGPGSRLTTFNLAQWSGDYSTAGVTGIRLEVNNFGATPLELRLLFANSTFTAFAASSATSLSAASGWTSVAFAVDAGNLTGLFGADPTAVLADVGALRLYHSPALAAPGAAPTFAGEVGFDSISAVPLPPAVWCLGTALAGLLARRRCRT